MTKRKTRKTKSEPWNKGCKVGQRDPFKLGEVKRIRKMLSKGKSTGIRDLALFNTALDTMLRSPDLLNLRVKDVRKRNRVMRDTIDISIRGRLMKCTLSESAKDALEQWIDYDNKKANEYIFTGRIRGKSAPIRSRTLNRQIKSWAEAIGLEDGSYGIETLRRTRALHILKHTGSMEAVRILLGLANIGTAARYLYDTNPVDAIEISRMYEI
jgi:integrase